MTFGSLFSGVGGLDLGFESAGHQCLWQVECDRQANAVRRRHWPDAVHVRDVAGFSRWPNKQKHWLKRYERPDVVVGGFPCQDVSVAGRRSGLAGNRSGLWWQMLRIIRGMEPDYVVWENVPGLLSSDRGRDFERVCSSLAERGYFGCVRVLDARFFGVPQRRRRLFGVFARGTGRDSGTRRCAEVLALAGRVPGNPAKGGQAGQNVAGTLGGGSGSRGWPSDTERMTFVPTVTTFDVKSSGQFGFGVGEVSPTLRSMGAKNGNKNGGGQVGITDGQGVRRLTPRECERLMGWPDDWTRWTHDGKEVADGPRYRMIGNGVAAPVAEWIGRRLAAVASGESRAAARS